MRISLPYDRGSFELDLGGRREVKVLGKRYPLPIEDHAGELQRAFEKPIGSPPLGDLISREGRISILVSDLTRSGSVGTVLRELLAYLRKKGAGPDRVEIVLAMGMHRGHSREELESLLGSKTVSTWTVSEHHATDEGSLDFIGTTPAGSPCLINSRIVRSKLVVALGTVSFHYFAGFGGGRKLILPGAAGERTILANHRLSLEGDPSAGLSEGCRPGNLDGNPVHEDMLAGARLLPCPVFAVNTVSDASGRAVFVNGGDLEESHVDGCRYLLDNFLLRFDHPYRCVIASAGGFPKDINLLQSHKALKHASYALEEGGIMLAAAACPEGVGSDSYRDSYGNGPEGVHDAVKERYTLNSQAAVSTFELAERFDIRVRSMMDEEEVSLFGFDTWKIDDTGAILKGISDDEIVVIVDSSSFLPYREA